MLRTVASRPLCRAGEWPSFLAMKRALVLFNPAAGRGRGAVAAMALSLALDQGGWRVRALETRGHGHAAQLLQRLGRFAQRAVVVGGDGTLREAASGMLAAELDLELGFVPLGNANVVARALGIPLELHAAVERAVQGAPRRLDVLRIGEHLALAMVGVGYDAQVTRRLGVARSRPLTRRWYALHGDSLYGVIGGAALFEWNPVRFALEVDGRPHPGRFAAAVLSNMETYAKGWAMTPGADPCDGRVDFMVRRRVLAPFGAMSLACAALRRRAPRFLADYGQGREVVLRGEGDLCWQADGDFLGFRRDLHVTVVPQAIRVVV